MLMYVKHFNIPYNYNIFLDCLNVWVIMITDVLIILIAYINIVKNKIH